MPCSCTGPAMREDAATKARRLLSEGRVTLRSLVDVEIRADVRGDSARVYSVRWSPAGWECPCDAMAARCSHVHAVQLITLEPQHEGRTR
jgi:uncharacterized Zn finger protein